MAFPGTTGMSAPMTSLSGGDPSTQGMNEQEAAMVKMVSYDKARMLINTDGLQMQRGMESCPIKTIMAGTMGFGLGGAFGLFMASVS